MILTSPMTLTKTESFLRDGVISVSYDVLKIIPVTHILRHNTKTDFYYVYFTNIGAKDNLLYCVTSTVKNPTVHLNNYLITKDTARTLWKHLVMDGAVEVQP
jgi:hypothetical protein